MLWIMVLGLSLNSQVITAVYGYYQDYSADSSSNDPYTRVFYSSSPHHFASGYTQNIDQSASSSSNSIPYALQQSEQDTSIKLPSYQNTVEDSAYPAEDYSSFPSSEGHSYPQVSYESAPHSSLSPVPTVSSFRDHETTKLEPVPTSADINPFPTYQSFPQTIHVGQEPINLGQHVQITKHVPIPLYKQIHVPVAKPIRIEIPHPIIIPVPKPYQLRVPYAHPVTVPVVKEISVPVEKLVPYPVERKVPYTVEKHVPYKVEKHVTVHVPQIYPIKVPIVKTIIHRVKGYGRLNLHGLGWN